MKKFFFGGIHPHYNKEMSIGTADLSVITPKQVVIPLHQHIGVPCEVLAHVGDRVLCGQKIGEGVGMCVPVHASVSGTVSAIEMRPHPNGQRVMSVVIDNDFTSSHVEYEGIDTPIAKLDPDTVLSQIREAGIVGMGGAAFPGSIKALSSIGRVDTLIANACECEPYITADDALLRRDTEQVLEGMLILCRLLSPGRAVLAVEDNKAEAIRKLNELKKDYPSVEITVLPTKYPQGSEKQLIQALTGRQVPPGGLPANVGCVVFNVSTFAAIFRAVRMGKPLTERIVTVSGEAVEKPQNFIVPIGTPFHDLVKAAGGLNDKTERVISGGPMMGVAQSDLSVPVVKATSSVLCLLRDRNGRAENPVCLRCGKCVSVCPMHLEPLYLYRFTLAEKKDELKRLNVCDCMECGSCAFTCPGKLPLVEKIRIGKELIKEDTSKCN